MPPKSEVLQGTLDLLVLKTLDTLGPMHGFGIAQRIQQVSQDVLRLNQGTLYPALLRLEQRGWISSRWGVSENNRNAKFYSLTRRGRRQLRDEAEGWNQMAAVRSEEHTSELQSRLHLVCRLLLEKKKIKRLVRSHRTPSSHQLHTTTEL